MEFFIVAKQKRGFVLLANSMACAIAFGGTSVCRGEARNPPRQGYALVLKNSFHGIFHCRKTKAWFCFAREFNGLRHCIRRHIRVPRGSAESAKTRLYFGFEKFSPGSEPRRQQR
ncbi:MAG: hypothetical protein OXF43_04615 [Gammaproteobacteria bacterium]|nr:hypothetical protein [Gammaproteobacteria bacterium]